MALELISFFRCCLQDSALSHSAMPGAAHPKFGEGGQVTNLEEAVEAMTSQQ